MLERRDHNVVAFEWDEILLLKEVKCHQAKKEKKRGKRSILKETEILTLLS